MNMKKFLLSLATLVLAAYIPAGAAPMKARVIQQPFSVDGKDMDAYFEWTINELKKCDESLDIVVLPEFSEVPGKTLSREEFLNTARKNGPILLETCAETARRCSTLVFAGAIDLSLEVPRNTIFVFNRQGEIIGKYYKEHLTRGEWDKLDKSYTEEWTQPYILDIEGVRYAFLTCYDFYFYENFSNIARWKPDVIIGSSHQRSDTFRALDIINTFCAYNTGAYLVRASVSMGLDSELGGCSCIVAPTGEILGTLRSEVASLDATFDPKAKYLKPAGYGNPPSLHSEYIEIGRRPWKYRPGGSAIVTPLDEAPAKRLCAHRGFSAVAPENSLAALGAAVALGASEVEFDLWWTKDGEIVSIHDATLDRVSDGTGKVYEMTYDELMKYDFGSKTSEHFKGLHILRFEDILKKLSCHTIMNIHMKSIYGQGWDEACLKKVVDLIHVYDADKHVYFATGDHVLHEQLANLAPGIPRCMLYWNGADIVDDALKYGCKIIQLGKTTKYQGYSNLEEILKKAKDNGLRCNIFWADDPQEARHFFEMGFDTILTNDYQIVADATGEK